MRLLVSPLSISQAASSAAGALLVLFGAWRMAPPQFTTFSLVVLILTVSTGLARSGLFQPVLIEMRTDRYAVVPWSHAVASAGVVVVTVMVGNILVSDLSVRDVAVLALLSSVPVLHDWLRFRCVGQGSTWAVAGSDGMRLALVPAVLLVASSPDAIILSCAVWCGGYALAAIPLAVVANRVEEPTPYSHYGGRARSQAYEYLVAQLATTVPMLVLGSIALASSIGAFRLSQSLYGPVNMLVAALALNLLSDAVAPGARPSDSDLVRRSWRLGAASCVIAVALGGLLAVVVAQGWFHPEGIEQGELLLALFAVGWFVALGGLISPHLVTLRVFRAQSSVTRARVGMVILTWLGFGVGYGLGGIEGSLFGGFICGGVGYVLFFLPVVHHVYLFRRERTRHTRVAHRRASAGHRDDALLKAARGALYAGLFLVSLLVFRVGGSITVGDVALVLSLLLTLFAIGRPRTRHPYGGSAVPFALLIAAGGCLAAVGSLNPADSLASLVRVLFVALVLPWQCVVLLNNEARLRRAILALGLGAAVCSLGTVFQFALGATVIPNGAVTNAGRYTGFTGHVSDTGAVASLAVVIGFAGLARGQGFATRVLLVGVGLSGLVGLVLSGSVSGMLAAAVGVGALLLIRGVPVRHVLFGGVAAGAVLWWAVGLIGETQMALTPGERALQVLGLSGGDASLNTTASRWDTIVAGWRGFLADPLTGAGLDSDSSLVIGSLGVHSLPFAALYQGGVLFAAGLAGCVLTAIVMVARSPRKSVLRAQAYSLAIAAGAFSLTGPNLYNRYFWVPIAIVAVLAALNEGQRGADIGPIRRESIVRLREGRSRVARTG